MESEEKLLLAYFLEWLQKHHLRIVRNMERKMCNCFHNLPNYKIADRYPYCINLVSIEEQGCHYWKMVLDNLCKDYPEIAMEYYMVGEG